MSNYSVVLNLFFVDTFRVGVYLSIRNFAIIYISMGYKVES